MRYLSILFAILIIASCNKKVIVIIELDNTDFLETIIYDEGKTNITKPPASPVTKQSPIKRGVFYFGFDENFLTESEMERLIKFSATIPEDDLITVVGGCCPIGTDEYNMKLGFDRAKSGQAYLSNMVKSTTDWAKANKEVIASDMKQFVESLVKSFKIWFH